MQLVLGLLIGICVGVVLAPLWRPLAPSSAMELPAPTAGSPLDKLRAAANGDGSGRRASGLAGVRQPAEHDSLAPGIVTGSIEPGTRMERAESQAPGARSAPIPRLTTGEAVLVPSAGVGDPDSPAAPAAAAPSTPRSRSTQAQPPTTQRSFDARTYWEGATRAGL